MQTIINFPTLFFCLNQTKKLNNNELVKFEIFKKIFF